MPFNLTVEPDGTDKAEFSTKGISLDPKAIDSVFTSDGTSIVIHERADGNHHVCSGNSGQNCLWRHHDSDFDVAQISNSSATRQAMI